MEAPREQGQVLTFTNCSKPPHFWETRSAVVDDEHSRRPPQGQLPEAGCRLVPSLPLGTGTPATTGLMPRTQISCRLPEGRRQGTFASEYTLSPELAAHHVIEAQ